MSRKDTKGEVALLRYEHAQRMLQEPGCDDAKWLAVMLETCADAMAYRQRQAGKEESRRRADALYESVQRYLHEHDGADDDE